MTATSIGWGQFSISATSCLNIPKTSPSNDYPSGNGLGKSITNRIGQSCFISSQCSLNIFVWGTAMACHAACTNFGGLLACRFVLGICEGSVTPGFMVVTSMFYTRKEQTLRVGYWCTLFSLGLPWITIMMLPLIVMMNGTGELVVVEGMG